MTSAEVDKFAKIIWDYHHMGHAPKKSDVIFVLGSLDTRVAKRAAQLYLDGFGDYLIFSGGVGALTKGKFTEPEAEIFADIALSMDVPKDKILIENRSTNTGENIQFTYALLKEKGLSPKSMLLVQKPYMERRTYASFKKQWPGPETEILVTSPEIAFEDYFNDANPKELIINVMVGDLQRVKEYHKLGYQIEQKVPTNVWQACKQLVELGYTEHAISAEDLAKIANSEVK